MIQDTAMYVRIGFFNLRNIIYIRLSMNICESIDMGLKLV